MYEDLITKDKANSPLLGLLKLDQIAFIARSDEDEALIKKQLRLEKANWVKDEVTARGYVRGAPRGSLNVAKLQFNYDYGIEIEILRYIAGPNYADANSGTMSEREGIKSCNPCHLGFHLEKGEELPDVLQNWAFACGIIQQVDTIEHTNQFLIDTGRRYRYTIYDTKNLLGIYLKVIERKEAV